MLFKRYYNMCASNVNGSTKTPMHVIDNDYILQCIVTQDKLVQGSIVECLSIAYSHNAAFLNGNGQLPDIGPLSKSVKVLLEVCTRT